jgi:pimeloyl-ACP methyl ester carboxylesterase
MTNYKINPFVILASIIVIGMVALAARYLAEIGAARETLNSLNSQVIETDCGPIEYARVGDGYPVLVIHGAMGGFDQGLMISDGNLDPGYQVISVSRFGYLRSPRPENATLNMQADAYACLLDKLGIEKAVVFATSAGANSGIRFTARYPERVSALVLLSPAAPGPVVVENPPLAVFNTLLRSEFVYWSMVTYFKPFMQRMVGVPDSLTLTPELEGMVDNLLAKTMPVGGRIDGMISDFTFPSSEFYEETSDTAPYPLRNIEAPVLVLNALDDPLAVPQNVRGLAEKFPNARLVVFPDGGHPILSHNEEVRAEINTFLKNTLASSDDSR